MSDRALEKKIGELLDVYSENRQELFKMIEELKKFKQKLETILPEGQLDLRYMRYFEEKVKAVTAFFNVILDIRKEVNKSLKEEIDIRFGKRLGKENEITDEKIRELARMVENVRRKQQQKVEALIGETDDTIN